ncbi:hypothetical protein N0V90_011585 [Kalmusia sp. IMI 367209]|nr:hypothetical protein N0V90_011585 [Kalmusia sp. IMI 367209]
MGITAQHQIPCILSLLIKILTSIPVARNPSKLRAFLESEHSLSSSTISCYLTIIKGDARSPINVTQTLISPTNQRHLVDVIYSSIGAYPKFQWSLRTPFVSSDPTLCEDGMKSIYTALGQLSTSGVTATIDGTKPLLIALSSTGVNGRARDIPYLYYPLYHILAAQPHADKRAMEQLILGHGGAHIRNFAIVRPTALTDAKEVGVENVRAGWEWGVETEGKEDGPAIGWTVGRRDVGAWIFRKVIAEGGWEGRCISLTS